MALVLQEHSTQAVSEAWEEAGQHEQQSPGRRRAQQLLGKLAVGEVSVWGIGLQTVAIVGAASGCLKQRGVFRKRQVVWNGEP